jgi:hypothetical protein
MRMGGEAFLARTPYTHLSQRHHITHRKKTSARQPTPVTSERLRQDTIMNDGEEDDHDDDSNVTTVTTKSNKETIMTTITAGAATAGQATVMVEQHISLPLTNASPDLRTRELVARYLADLQPTCNIR